MVMEGKGKGEGEKREEERGGERRGGGGGRESRSYFFRREMLEEAGDPLVSAEGEGLGVGRAFLLKGQAPR